MIKGIVEDYSVKDKGDYFIHSITVDGVRYSCFGQKGKANAARGDRVQFEAFKKDKYWNFDPKSFSVLERGAVDMSKVPTEGDKILRQNAMAHAVRVVTAQPKDLTDVEMIKRAINIAELFIIPYTKSGILPDEVKENLDV